ncbi:MAG: histidine phosphatase family protein [Bifidobacteriaceae bacterium]|jgi:phosphohistidine phosphatase|nr:histidine phosphatase family protein [Bifidobacteriaceae bacterium]
MERTLVLVRHAKAGGGDGGNDQDRQLSEIGYEQCRIVSRELSSFGLAPSTALVSKARRAKQTFNAMAAAAQWAVEPIILDALYTGYVEDALAAIREVDPQAGTVMVFGHEPTMSAVAYKLAGPGSDPHAVARVRRGLPTTGVAVVQVDGPWESVGLEPTKLRWVFTPLA